MLVELADRGLVFKGQEKNGNDVKDGKLELSRRLAELIAVRGARLCAYGVAAICLKQGNTEGHVAADGSLANKHPKLKKRWAKALGETLDWDGKVENEDPIITTSADDGSGVGCAIIAAMELGRRAKHEEA
ncbi:Hexokinase isoenzyme 2 [Didymosphaeria variabile]|uniref:Phosphotransferase n=1 Tax=Didymosphaeria variabile TaxID=1932322 RepID=A0A9W8XG91_9PLEO|nr:Hexokinase isoenzyme 2 [Didymosphaeria variabile]KAJ4348398.1 Hexokinase isoenzyme 2 [Didymosphaeria variabile]